MTALTMMLDLKLAMMHTATLWCNSRRTGNREPRQAQQQQGMDVILHRHDRVSRHRIRTFPPFAREKGHFARDTFTRPIIDDEPPMDGTGAHGKCRTQQNSVWWYISTALTRKLLCVAAGTTKDNVLLSVTGVPKMPPFCFSRNQKGCDRRL